MAPQATTQYATLTANTVSAVSFNPPAPFVTLTNRNGAAEVFFTADGTTPTIGGAGTYMIPAQAGAYVRVKTANVDLVGGSATYINMISAGAATVEVDASSIQQGGGVPASQIVATGVAVFTSLNAAAATATGAVLDCTTPHQAITLQVNLATATAPTAISTQLQASLDNVNFFNVGTALTSTAAGTTFTTSSGTPARYFRAVTTITGGTGVSLTALLAVAA